MRVLGAHLRGWMLTPLLVAAALAAGDAVYRGLQTPGEVIRRELAAAGSEFGRLPWSIPSDSVQRRITPYFAAAHGATVDARGFPVFVRVTLHDLGRDACLDARRVARRIGGRVVIAVDRRTDEETCRDHTAMTWRIAP
jgi:hypothetical protein